MTGSSVRAKWAVISMLVVGFSINAATVHADSVGPNSPTTCVNDNSVGDVDWFTPERAVSANNQYAARFTGTQTSYLKCTDFGFNIPSGRSIAGIVVENEVATTSGGNNTVDAAQRIVRSGVIGSQNRNNPMVWPLLTDTYLSHGSPTDTWGECWCAMPTGQACDNPACGNVNNPDFGAALSAGPSGGTIAGRVDHVRISVHFTPPCGLTAPGNTCVPGGGSRRSDCEMELRTSPVPPLRRNIPVNRLTCFEGDRFCDTDLDITNNSCTISTSFCINNNDPRFPDCVPSQLVSFEVKKPNPARLKDADDTVNLATLEDEGGAGGFGLSVLRKGTVVYAGSANAITDICGGPRDIVVPLRVANSGKVSRGSKSIRIQSTNALGKRDADSFRYTCKPSTCGNNIIEIDHEDCDDGNRNNGDGCDQGCRIEVAPVNTATPTNTPTAAGDTPTQTVTRTPTRTPTITPTDTPAVPVDTPTQTATPTVDSEIAVILAPGGGSTNSCRGTCVGGANNGNACVIAPNCPGGTCSNRKCVGGPYDTLTCANALDCNGCDPNQVCSAAGVPLACCSGNNAGTCPVVGSCALVQNLLFAVRVPLNGVCTPRTIPDTFCLTDVECTGGATCVLSKLGIVPGTPDVNGEAPLLIPASSVVLNPAVVSGIGTVCVAFAADGVGVHDCDGGRADLDLAISLDHNTSPNGCLGGTNEGMACTTNANCPAGTFETCAGTCTTGTNVTLPCASDNDCPSFPFDCNNSNSGTANGLPDDPQCDDTFLLPDTSISYACKEGDMQCNGGVNEGMVCSVPADCPGAACTLCNSAVTHPGVCNSPNHGVVSGTFGSGDIVISAPLTLTILAGAANNGPDNMPCTADDTPGSPPAPVQVVLGTGTQSVTVFEAANQLGSKIAPATICGSQPCVAQITGQGLSCAALGGGSVTGLKLGGGFPALDTTAGDIATVFQFSAQ